MKPGRFWTLFVVCVLGGIAFLLLLAAFVGAVAAPKMCETVQTHENRSVTVCR